MAIQIQSRHIPAWTFTAGLLLLLGSSAAVATVVLTSGDGAAPAPDPSLVAVSVPERPAVPPGRITYEITGKGLFTADGAGFTLNEPSAPKLASETATGSDSVTSPDGRWTATAIHESDGSVQLNLTGADGSNRVVWSLAGPDDPALVAAGKVQARR